MSISAITYAVICFPSANRAGQRKRTPRDVVVRESSGPCQQPLHGGRAGEGLVVVG
jgi:hypothetical protein